MQHHGSEEPAYHITQHYIPEVGNLNAFHNENHKITFHVML